MRVLVTNDLGVTADDVKVQNVVYMVELLLRSPASKMIASFVFR